MRIAAVKLAFQILNFTSKGIYQINNFLMVAICVLDRSPRNGSTAYEKLTRPTQGQKEFQMKRAMIRKRHRPEEIVAKLRETDEALAQGKSLEDVAKSLGVSLMTLHRWRTEYGSTDRDAVKRLKELERENGRLKRLVADQALDIQILKEVAKGEF